MPIVKNRRKLLHRVFIAGFRLKTNNKYYKMNIERKNIDEVNATLTLLVEKNDYEEKVEKTLRSYRQKASVPGFRPGHVPAALVKKMYGKAVLLDELNKLVSDKILSYIKENNVKVLGEPMPSESQKSLDLDTQETFEFVFDIAIAPDFSVELNKKVSLPYYDITIDEKMMENTIKSYTGRLGSYDQADDIAEADVVKGDVVELENGNAKEGGLAVNDVVLCPKYMKDDAQKALFVGVKKDGIVVFNPKKAFENENEIASLLKIAKDKVADVTGDFQFSVKGITRYKEAELNQDFFDKAFGKDVVKSEEEFKQKIQDELKSSLSIDTDFKLMMDARAAFLKKLDGVAFPDDFLKRWVLSTNEKVTKEALDNDYPKMVEDLKWHLIKEKIAADNNVKVEDADLKEFAKKTAKAQFAQYGMMSVPDDVLEGYVKDMLGKKENLNNIVDKVVEDKVIAVIKSAVKLNTKSISLDEFNKMFEEK